MTDFNEYFRKSEQDDETLEKGRPKKMVARNAKTVHNKEDAKAGAHKKHAARVTSVRGGMSGGHVESRELGGRPKKDPSVQQEIPTRSPVHKAFPVIDDTQFRVVEYVADVSAPKAAPKSEEGEQ